MYICNIEFIELIFRVELIELLKKEKIAYILENNTLKMASLSLYIEEYLESLDIYPEKI